MRNRHYLITGGSTGIGFAIAESLIADGAFVHICARRTHLLEEARDRLGPRCFTHVCDVGQAHLRDSLLASVAQLCGGALDGLVNSAARYGFRPAADTDGDELLDYFRINLVAPAQLAKACLPLLSKGQGKSILHISSNLGARPIPGVSSYAASKAALNSLTQSQALEWAPQRIRVNAILPGVVDTPIHEPRNPSDPTRADKIAALGPAHPLGRIGLPSDIAAAACFLLSDQAAWVTGSLFFIDGGISLV